MFYDEWIYSKNIIRKIVEMFKNTWNKFIKRYFIQLIKHSPNKTEKLIFIMYFRLKKKLNSNAMADSCAKEKEFFLQQ